MEEKIKKPEESDILHTSDGEMPDVDEEEKRIQAAHESEKEIEETFGEESEEPKKGVA